MKLITKEIGTRLREAYEHSAETGESGKEVLAKYFTPWANATWYVSEGMPVDRNGEPMSEEAVEFEGLDHVPDWHLYGFCDLGDPWCAELGYVMLSDLKNLKGPAGLRVERDLYYSGTMAEVLADYEKARAA